jgi:hypothetical protein
MPRKARIEFAGAAYHLLDRGDRREAIFRDGEQKRSVLKSRQFGSKFWDPAVNPGMGAKSSDWRVRDGDAAAIDEPGSGPALAGRGLSARDGVQLRLEAVHPPQEMGVAG